MFACPPFRSFSITAIVTVVCISLVPLPAGADQETVDIATATVIARYPHDSQAFTQGLLYYQGRLYESTGLRGRSTVRRVDIETGHLLDRSRLPERFFGEGLARVGERLFQLTWKAGVAFVYALPGLKRINRFQYPGQGWGLTWNGRYLIMSDGSSTLRFLEPDTFRTKRLLEVTRSGHPVDKINELEYIHGEIWANVRFSDNIIRIDPQSGRVTGVIKAGHLRKRLPASAGVLNGIAWDRQGRRLFITGKNWPAIFRIELPADK